MKKAFAKIVVMLVFANIVFAQSVVNNKSLDALMKRHKACEFLTTEVKSRGDRTYVRNAAYAYHYWYPGNFKEEPSKDFNDTIRYLSRDKKANFKLWPGKTVRFPLGTVDRNGHFIGVKAADIIRLEKVVDDYIRVISSGREQYIGRAKIIELCKGIDGYNFTINVRAADKQTAYIYKIEVSELPVSGDLIFKHFLFEYKLDFRKDFENCGLLMANDFGMWQRKEL